MRLEDLIDALATVPYDTKITFDDGSVPVRFDSWRGIYAHLALEYEPENSAETLAGDLLKLARMSVGRTFLGYKGGEYEMSLFTPVWKDNYGEYSSTGIFKLVPHEHGAVLTTAYIGDYA